MNTFMKTVPAFSIVAVALMGAAVPASAAEPATDQRTMTQGQAQSGTPPSAMPGYGPGMMGGGYGPGMMGGGYGPGMMGGGYGPGMMGGGYGPGMMGGGYGPGMMGGGYGPGMMGGGYGPGMMGGWAAGAGPMAMLDLSDAQRAQLEKIQTEMIQRNRTLMRQMWEEQNRLSDLNNAEKRDPAAIGKAYSKLADIQRQALEARIAMENRMEGVLTKEQKAQLHRGYGWRMMGY
ncbi:MAG: Spy/CpxP family protein refolding chaperone [Thiobacillus sp.]